MRKIKGFTQFWPMCIFYMLVECAFEQDYAEIDNFQN